MKNLLLTPAVLGLTLVLHSFTLNPTSTKADSDFVKKAYMAGCAEVAAGNLAIQKGKDPAVVDLAKMMVKDHTEANEKLKSLATDMPSLDSLDAKHKAMKAKLMALSGDAFDKAYLQGQVADHNEAIALFSKESSGGQDANLKSFATETLPKLKMHLEHVQMLTKK